MRCRTYARMSCRMSPISTFRLELSAPTAPARPDTRASSIRPPAVFLVALRARKDKTLSQFLRNKAAAARWDTPSQRGRRGNEIERDFPARTPTPPSRSTAHRPSWTAQLARCHQGANPHPNAQRPAHETARGLLAAPCISRWCTIFLVPGEPNSRLIESSPRRAVIRR